MPTDAGQTLLQEMAGLVDADGMVGHADLSAYLKTDLKMNDARAQQVLSLLGATPGTRLPWSTIADRLACPGTGEEAPARPTPPAAASPPPSPPSPPSPSPPQQPAPSPPQQPAPSPPRQPAPSPPRQPAPSPPRQPAPPPVPAPSPLYCDVYSSDDEMCDYLDQTTPSVTPRGPARPPPDPSPAPALSSVQVNWGGLAAVAVLLLSVTCWLDGA